jgi:hypothetical protein
MGSEGFEPPSDGLEPTALPGYAKTPFSTEKNNILKAFKK